MEIIPGVPLQIHAAYYEAFGAPIPVGPWHGLKVIHRAVKEAQRALEGKRGPLMDSEFPMDCPPGAIL